MSDAMENKYSTSLLWRAHDLDSSGSSNPDYSQFDGPDILCLRKPKTQTETGNVVPANVVVFQNFECNVDTLVQVDPLDARDGVPFMESCGRFYTKSNMTLKVGFVFPDEIIGADIMAFAVGTETKI